MSTPHVSPPINKQRCAELERQLVACLLGLDNLSRPWGPNICTALAHAPVFWVDPFAARLAGAIRECIQNPTRANIRRTLGMEWSRLLTHPWLDREWMPIDQVEQDALSLIQFYGVNKLRNGLGAAWDELLQRPENCREVVERLKTTLEHL